MAEHVILFCNLEHLRAHDIEGTPGKWAFGLNLSVGISGEISGTSLDDLKPYMQPWTWPKIAQVKVRIRDGASGQTSTLLVEPVKWKGEIINCGHCRDEQEALRSDLDKEYDRSKAVGFPAFTWQPTGALSKLSPIRSRPWHTFVGQLSTNPPPFPQCLNLSYIFFVDKLTTPGAKSVFAAPLLPKTSTCAGLSLPWNNVLVPKNDAPQEWTGHPGIFQWEYQTEAGGTVTPPLIAHMAECAVRLDTTPVATFLDLNTQWVGKLTGDLDTFEEDWRPMVEERMADGLDLPQRIIEYLRANLDNPAVIPQLKLFQWAALASLRDLVGAGIYPGPDNRRFVNFAFRTVDENYAGIESQLAAIETRVKENFGTLKDWLLFLAANLPEVSNLSVLSPPRAFEEAGVPKLQEIVPEEQTTVASVVAELEQLHKAVLDPKNLVVLLRQQWRLIFKDILSARDMASMEKVNLDSLNVRHYLALENLGDLWKVFVRMPSDGASGHNIIRKNFSCLFQEYFCKRFNLGLAGLMADLGGPPVPCDVTAIDAGDYRSGQASGNGSRQPEKATVFEKPGVKTLVDFQFDPIRQAIVDYIRNWSKTFVENLIPRNNEPTTVPHAITLQVDGLAARPDDSKYPDKQDILRRISGIGVLMRQEGKDWRCLNFAAAYKNSEPTLIADPVLVPSRLNYRNDLRQAFVTYNNQPLTAESPLAEDAMTPVKLRLPSELSQAEQVNRNAPPLIRLKYSNDSTARHLPGLEFGKNFEILPFMVANCGALPKALLANDPARRSPIEAAVADFTTAKLDPNDQTKIRTIKYLRKVRVGGIRVLDTEGHVSLKMPPIPDTVIPRARDIHRTELDRVKLFTTAPNPDPAQYPILLLAPKEWAEQNTGATNTFGFCIRKPATDLNTWDRWIAGSLAPDRRASVWADFYRWSENKRTAATPAQGTDKFELHDTSIDDPATLNRFLFELWLIDGASTTPLKSLWVDVIAPTEPKNLESVQSQLMHVTCSLENTEDITDTDHIVIGGKSVKEVKVKVKQGQVYQLNVFTCVAKTDYDSRFADVISTRRQVLDPNNVPVFLMSPFNMLIETATEDLIEGLQGDNAAQRIWDRLMPTFAPAAHPGAIAFTVAPTDVSSDEGFQFLQRAELLRQVWRWQGRETPLHPCLKANSSCKQNGQCVNLDSCVEMDEWEAWEFGNRFETDHLVQDMITSSPTRLGGRKFFYKEVLERGNADTDELRALHYRFAVKVFSRYAGIMPSDVASSLISRGRIPVARNEIRETEWRRLFVPYRRKKELPIPKVKLILPLTESFGEEVGNTAGLLLVLNEPWYQEGGLGEGIAAEVQMTPDPTNEPKPATDKAKSPSNKRKAAGDTETFYFELGTDPIVELAARGYRQSTDPGNEFRDEICLNQKIRGPVGHTFDRANESPLFATTSFIIPAPTIFSTKKGESRKQLFPDFAWNFCRLRLRRVVTLSKQVAARTDCRLTTPDEVANCVTPDPASQMVGPFTDPYWVQYLPEFSHFAPADKQLSDARLKLEQTNPLQLNIVDRAGQTIPLSPTATLNGSFELYLVLTRRVFDVAGRPEQEVYLEVFHQDANNLWVTSKPPSLSSDAGLRARIIEVQRRPPDGAGVQKFDYGEPLWLALFGPKDKEEDKTLDKDLARIVRISQPIEGLSTLNC